MDTVLRLLPLVFLPALAACGGDGASTRVRVDPAHEAHVTFQGEKTFLVTISNEGPSPIEVLWPTRMLDVTVPAGTDAGQTISADFPIRIRCPSPDGSTVRLASARASGVSVRGRTPD